MSNFQAVEAFSQNISKTDKEEKKLGSNFFFKKTVKIFSIYNYSTTKARGKRKKEKPEAAASCSVSKTVKFHFLM